MTASFAVTLKLSPETEAQLAQVTRMCNEAVALRAALTAERDEWKRRAETAEARLATLDVGCGLEEVAR